MVVLVTGGAGMIGSHMCERLLLEEHRVICLDNLVTGRLENIQPLARNPLLEFIQHDVVNELPRLPRVDRVYHMASPASPPGYTRYPIETMRVNSEGTLHMLELARQHHARFLYTSTSEAYGDPLEHPQSEEYRGNVSTTGPRSMYDEAKRFGEAMTATYIRARDTDARIVRIFNTYGPHSDPDDGRLVMNFITQALRGMPITIYGDGQQTRSLCYVTDLVDGLVRAMECDGTRGQVINLGNPEEYTVLEFALRIRHMTGSSSGVIFTEYAVGDDPRMRRPNIDKARRLLGWEPRVGLKEGLEKTIAYFRSSVGAPSAVAVNGAQPNGAHAHAQPNGAYAHGPQPNGGIPAAASESSLSQVQAPPRV